MFQLASMGPAALSMFGPSMGSNAMSAYLQGLGGGGLGNMSQGGGSGFGMNLGTANMALGGLQTIGNLWSAYEANKLARKQFAFQKDITETNLANQILSYNTALEDRMRSRAYTEQGQPGGTTAESAQSYLDQNRLQRRPR